MIVAAIAARSYIDGRLNDLTRVYKATITLWLSWLICGGFTWYNRMFLLFGSGMLLIDSDLLVFNLDSIAAALSSCLLGVALFCWHAAVRVPGVLACRNRQTADTKICTIERIKEMIDYWQCYGPCQCCSWSTCVSFGVTLTLLSSLVGEYKCIVDRRVLWSSFQIAVQDTPNNNMSGIFLTITPSLD